MSIDCGKLSGNFYEKQTARTCNFQTQNEMARTYEAKLKDYLSKEVGTKLSELKRAILIGQVKNQINAFKMSGENFDILKDYFERIIENKEFDGKELSEDDEIQIEELRLALIELGVDLIPESPLDFDVTGGYIVRKSLKGIDFKGLKTKLLLENKIYQVGNNTVEVLGYQGGEMRYNIHIDLDNKGNRKQTLHIGYNGGNVIKLFDANGNFLDYIKISSKSRTVERGKFNKNGSFYREKYTENITAKLSNKNIGIELKIIFKDVDKKSKYK